MRSHDAPIVALLWILFTSATWITSSKQLFAYGQPQNPPIDVNDGLANLNQGKQFLKEEKYEEAIPYFWRAVLAHEKSSQNGHLYDLQDTFESFLKCFASQGKLIDGFLFVAKDAVQRDQMHFAELFLEQAKEINPEHEGVKELQYLMESIASVDSDGGNLKDQMDSSFQLASHAYDIGIGHFNQKHFALAAAAFEESCTLGGIGENSIFRLACTNAVYCRSNINDWGSGPQGAQFVKDMETIASITAKEVLEYKAADDDHTGFKWKRGTSVGPHMMLSYPGIDPMLKRQAAESHAYVEEILNRFDGNTGQLTPLPEGLPYEFDSRREKFKDDTMNNPNFKIKVGFVSSAFSSKAVLYLSHDMFRFFDKSKYEIHIFSLGPPDSPEFIKQSMRGVDWRERVKQNVDYFHDVQHLKDDHIKLANTIHDLDIHILIEWDGHARQGDRAHGLLALKPAPVQILHQEFLGTYGGEYIDYIITDRTTSPEEFQEYYTEKFIYMPNHFFSKGHAVQAELEPPLYDYKPAQTPYVIGTGSPQENRCLSPLNVGPEQVSFVYCNFNKFVKLNPETVVSWIEILRSVPDSIICLLENPQDGVENLRNFVNDVASSSEINDGDELNDRIHFLTWEIDPFVHQSRNRDFCNAIVDSHPYNGHTTAQDGTFSRLQIIIFTLNLNRILTFSHILALYGGIPIVTRSDGVEMSSRVSTSANVVLGMEELNAKNGIQQYIEIATKLGTNEHFFEKMRTKLVHTCLQENPMHPYWDVERYVGNFQRGLHTAWHSFLSGNAPKHIIIEEPSADEDQHSAHSDL
jgi:protein O-GlcNAc transferase